MRFVKTIEDAEEYKRNAVDILRKNTQYATAKATEEAFDVLMAYCRLVDEYSPKTGGAE